MKIVCNKIDTKNIGIDFASLSWKFSDFKEVPHSDQFQLIGFYQRSTGHVWVEICDVQIKFGQPSPSIVFKNPKTNAVEQPNKVWNDEDFAPLFHYNTIVSHRFVLFADGSNVLAGDGFRLTEKVYRVFDEGIRKEPSVVLQTFCTRDIDVIHHEMDRIHRKYENIYFITPTTILSTEYTPSFQVIR